VFLLASRPPKDGRTARPDLQPVVAAPSPGKIPHRPCAAGRIVGQQVDGLPWSGPSLAGRGAFHRAPDITVVSEPEFLREARRCPQSQPRAHRRRCRRPRAAQRVGRALSPATVRRSSSPTHHAETIKVTGLRNAFLATEAFSFINAIAALCEGGGCRRPGNLVLGLGLRQAHRVSSNLGQGRVGGGSLPPQGPTSALVHSPRRRVMTSRSCAGEIPQNDEQPSASSPGSPKAAGGSLDGGPVGVSGG